MAQKSIKKEQFAKFYVKTWIDSGIQDLDLFEERFFLVSWSNMISIKAITGIYEMPRSAFELFGFSDSRVDMLTKYGLFFPESKFKAYEMIEKIIDSFNTNHTSMLEYDTPKHTMFVKNYFKKGYKTIGNTCVAVKMILNDHDQTRLKVPEFWKEFAKINERELTDILDKLLKMIESAKASLQITSLGDKEKAKISQVISEYEALLEIYGEFLQSIKFKC